MRLRPVKRNPNKFQIAMKKPCWYNPMDIILVLSLRRGRNAKGKIVKLPDGKYVHIELVFPNSYREAILAKAKRGNKKPVGTSFSSSSRGGRKGVSFADIKFKHYKNWDFYNVWSQSDSYIWRCLNRAFKIDGLPYDFSVIEKFGLNKKDADNKNKYWCSEAVAKALGFKPITISPYRAIVVSEVRKD